MPHMKINCAKKFVTAARTVLSAQPAEAQRITDAYGVGEADSDEDAFPGVLNFINDVLFFAPVLAYARGWQQGNAYVYYFNELNPWDGPWKGKTNHILDLAYLFQNFRDSLTPEQQAVGNAFAEDFFKFCHGKAPWPALQPQPTQDGGSSLVPSGFTARVYGPSPDATASTVAQPFGGDSHRRSILFDSDKVSLDDLAGVFGVFQASA